MTRAEELLNRFEELPPATDATSRMNIPLGTPQNLGLVSPVVQGRLTYSVRKKKKNKKMEETMTRAEELLQTSEATVGQEVKMLEKQMMTFRKKMEDMGQAGAAGPAMMKAVIMATPKDARKYMMGWLKTEMGNM